MSTNKKCFRSPNRVGFFFLQGRLTIDNLDMFNHRKEKNKYETLTTKVGYVSFFKLILSPHRAVAVVAIAKGWLMYQYCLFI
jgi:hypothetical protein